VPIVYQLLKSVGHSTRALTEIVTPYLDNPDNQSWRGAMSAYRARMKTALDGLDATPMQADWRDNNRSILENNIAFMDDCLAKGSISAAALQEFAKKQSPLLKRNIAWAAQTQVGHWMQVIDDWKTMLGSDLWQRARRDHRGRREARDEAVPSAGRAVRLATMTDADYGGTRPHLIGRCSLRSLNDRLGMRGARRAPVDRGTGCYPTDLVRTHRPRFHPRFDERSRFLLRAGSRLATKSRRPGPTNQSVGADVMDQFFQ